MRSQALRHELSAMGGWFAGDVTDGAPTYGGAYTFHFTEDLGLEASYLRTREHYEILDAIADRQAHVGVPAACAITVANSRACA